MTNASNKYGQRSVEIVEVNTLAHIGHLLFLAQRHIEEFMPELEYDEQICLHNFGRFRQDPDRLYCNAYLAYKNDIPVGYVLGTCYPMFVSNKKQAELKYWYVSPNYRRSTAAGFLLIKAFERWAKKVDAFQIILGVSHKEMLDMTEKVSSMFTKMGYPKVGYYHIRDVEG